MEKLSIVYGNISFWLGKKADTTASHKWICYVRGIDNQDLGAVVSKVVFILHPSFTNNVREVTQHPFEIHEVGWGEFEIQIKIVFREEYQKSLDLYHLLKLHPSQMNIQQSTKKPIVSEVYDEIVFMNPSKKFQNNLQNMPVIQQIPQNNNMQIDEDNYIQNINYQQFYQTFDFQSNFQQIEDASEYIDSEIHNIQSKIGSIQEEIVKLYKNQIFNKSQQNNQQINNSSTTKEKPKV